MAEKKQSTKLSTKKIIDDSLKAARDHMHGALANISSSAPVIDETKVKFLSNPKIMAALGAASATAGASLAGLIKIRGRSLFPLPYKIGAGILGGIAGYQIPSITKKYQGLNKEEIQDLNKSYLKNVSNITDKYLKLQAPVAAVYNLTKTSSFGSVVGSVAGMAGRAIRPLSGMAWRAIKPLPGMAWRNKYIRRPIKIGLAGAGLTTAGTYLYKGYKHFTRPSSGENYNTMLRNNILAGNINQEELSQDDMINVRRLGMR